MVKNDLIDELTRAFPGITKTDMSAMVNTLVESIAGGLERGEPIDLRGFGRLTVRKRSPIKGRNPRTAIPVNIPLRWVVHFKPADGLTKRINENEKD
jgi:integration host factor subunit beta